MFLERLIISNDSGVIRDIPFFMGVNYIVDETPVGVPLTTSGNNVGKTTLLAVIDYCLGAGDAGSVYRDHEFKKNENKAVREFLENTNVTCEMIVTPDLTDKKAPRSYIKRCFSDNSRWINDEKYSSEEKFNMALRGLFFGKEEGKPSFRQIIKKNIRFERQQLDNTVKVLHSSTSDAEYELLYLFWLGIPADETKVQFVKDLREEQNFIKILNQEMQYESAQQQLKVIEGTIEKLLDAKEEWLVEPDLLEAMERRNAVQVKLNELTIELGRLELREQLINRSVTELHRDKARIDVSYVEELYKAAKSLIPSLQKDLVATLSFHNAMQMEKERFITKELPEIKRLMESLQNEIDDMSVKEKELASILRKLPSLLSLDEIATKLSEEHHRKGELDKFIETYNNSKKRMERIKEMLREINEAMKSKLDEVHRKVTILSDHFTAISEKFYSERFYLYWNTSENTKTKEPKYSIEIASVEGKVGTGKKKTQIHAFDFAYILFADEQRIPCLHFIIHDQVENIHENQILSIYEEANSINCQYITPILRSSLPKVNGVEKHIVLKLSEQDKLFRIP